MRKRIAILGSTGSIGRQTLDVIRQHSDLFQVELLTANNSADLLVRQAVEFDANAVVICNGSRYDEVDSALSGHGIKVFTGMQSVCDLVCGDNIDVVVAAMVGFSGLRPVLAAIDAGKTIALANKETLVTAGSVVMGMALRRHARILPVDSEHSAIFQCLLGAGDNEVERLHLTASGGPFRTWDRESIARADVASALRHPNWQMGAKITIDSATMMNKGFEVIEAKWLFGVDPERINVVVHPESVVHSMVEYADGAVVAQLALPDMREPIQFALSFPHRLPLEGKRLDFAELGALTFERPDMEKFPCLALACEALRRGGNAPCVLNAANEIAVAAYLGGQTSFYGISDIVERCLSRAEYVSEPDVEDIFETDAAVRAFASTLV